MEMLDEVLQFLADWLETGARVGDSVRVKMVAEGHLANWQRARQNY